LLYFNKKSLNLNVKIIKNKQNKSFKTIRKNTYVIQYKRILTKQKNKKRINKNKNKKIYNNHFNKQSKFIKINNK